MNRRPHYKDKGVGFVSVEHPPQPRGKQCPQTGFANRGGTKRRSSACRHFKPFMRNPVTKLAISLARFFISEPLHHHAARHLGMRGCPRWREHAITDKATASATDYDKDLSDDFHLPFFHQTTPAALACWTTFPTKAGAAATGLALASFIRRQTLARDILCFLATCVRLMPERRS